jgi:K+-transporting ATPase ATPase C chain
MTSTLRPCLAALVIWTLLLGLLYPTSVWFFGRVLFTSESQGSLILHKGKIIGSELIAQDFSRQSYFWPRPSMTSGEPYNFLSSGGSQMSPANTVFIGSVLARVNQLHHTDKETVTIPIDIVTASASGLDPHISVPAAYMQARRIAAARRIPVEDVHTLIKEHTEPRTLGILGEPRANVLLMNLALDNLMKGQK